MTCQLGVYPPPSCRADVWSQVTQVTRVGCGTLTLKLLLVDPELDEDDDEREVTETEVRPCRGIEPQTM